MMSTYQHKLRHQGSVFPGRWVKEAGEGREGGTTEGTKVSLGEAGTYNHLIMCGRPGGAEKPELSHWGSVFPERCETRLGEGRGGSNGGCYNEFGCSWCT